MKHLKLFLLFILISFSVQAQEQQQDSLRILWIGNSYTYFNELPEMVKQIASTQHMKMAYTKSVFGGEQFSGHLKRESLQKLLAGGGWDYVVLQEQSSNPAKPTEMVARDVYPFARELCQTIRKKSPNAKIIFYMTWGHKDGNQDPMPNYPLDDTYEGMQNRIITTYLEMTYQNNAWCAPVGMAWKRIRQEEPNIVLYNQDQSHPSKTGSYLAANVIFSTILQKGYQTDYTAELEAKDAEYIQRTAQNTVLGNLELLNIIKNDDSEKHK